MSGEHEDSLHDFSKLGARKSTNCFHRNKLATGVRSSTNHFHRTVLERQKIIYADDTWQLRANSNKSKTDNQQTKRSIHIL